MTIAPGGDTIFALSSGAPPAAIAVVRISGPQADLALQALAGPLPRPRMATYRTIRDAGGTVLDRGLILWFPGNRTATGEPLAELHLHGGRAVVALVCEALSAAGPRPAAPGEFSRRAFLNGRIDLTAAEGLADLLEAETRAEHARAMRIAEGGLGRVIDRWRATLLDLAAAVEATIEFGETEDDVPAVPHGLPEALAALLAEMSAMIDRPPAERLKDGVRVVIAGPPNLGKSTLLNMLVGREAALATPVPGTTRDVIEVPIRLGDHAVILIDTAGLRESADMIEQMGVTKALAAMEDADLILWCGEPASCPDPQRSMMLQTRADEQMEQVGRLPVSIHDPDSIDMLRRNIELRIRMLTGSFGEMLLNVRQRQAIDAARQDLTRAARTADVLLLAEDLRMAMAQIDRLSGRSSIESMLDQLFGRFCVGK